MANEVSNKLPSQMNRQELYSEIDFWQVRLKRKRVIDQEYQMMNNWIEFLRLHLKDGPNG